MTRHVTKIGFIGATKVGKTQLIKCFFDESFSLAYRETLIIERRLKDISSTDKVKHYLELVDFPGRECFKDMTSRHYGEISLFVL